MAKWNPRIAYIDGFAGPGRYKGGEEGSPIIVLRRARDFIRDGHLKPKQLTATFVEADEERFKHLEQEIAALREEDELYNDIEIRTVHATFEKTMDDMWDRLGPAKLEPTFAFIDPFGLKHTPYNHFQKLLSFRKTEIFVNLMYEELNRFLKLEEMQHHFDSLFGNGAWRSLRDIEGAPNRRVAIGNYFRERLHHAGAEYVLVFEMRNNNDATDYLLFFATKSDKGLEVMKEAMWQVDKSGGFSFSDYTYGAGPMLIEPQPDYSILQRQLVAEFTGKEVGTDAVNKFVLAKTSFFRFKKEALKPLEIAGDIEVTPPPGKNHRKGSYPAGCKIRFLRRPQ